MSPPAAPRFDLKWAPANLAALIALCALAAWPLLREHARRPLRVGWRLPVDRKRVEAATEKIDPNVAGLASLVRLPGIGPARARAVIEYRDAHGTRPFRSAEDLTAVRGIGPGTVARIESLLVFAGSTDSG